MHKYEANEWVSFMNANSFFNNGENKKKSIRSYSELIQAQASSREAIKNQSRSYKILAKWIENMRPIALAMEKRIANKHADIQILQSEKTNLSKRIQSKYRVISRLNSTINRVMFKVKDLTGLQLDLSSLKHARAHLLQQAEMKKAKVNKLEIALVQNDEKVEKISTSLLQSKAELAVLQRQISENKIRLDRYMGEKRRQGVNYSAFSKQIMDIYQKNCLETEIDKPLSIENKVK